MKWNVCCRIVTNGSVEVEADTEEQAEAQAQSLFDESGSAAFERPDEEIEFVGVYPIQGGAS